MKVRLRMFCAVLALMLLPWAACAEIGLTLSAQLAAAGSPVDFAVEGEHASGYRYTLMQDGKTLFSAESARSAGSYVPVKTGEYTLLAEADGESAEADFTVTEALRMHLPELPSVIRTGEPLKVKPAHEGGAGDERYFYTILSEGRTLLRTEGSADWHWVPEQAGEYTLLVTVQDAGGAQAKAKSDFTVEAGGGLSAEATGGELSANGGQKSWIIYAVQPWTAQSNADFLILENTEGTSGDSLTVTVRTPTEAYREGTILLQSGSHQLTITAAQSAGYGVDEEVSLFTAAQSVYVDGRVHAVWANAQGSRSFRIKAAEAWQAEAEADFIHLEKTETELTLTVDESEENKVRSGVIVLTSGGSTAYIHVYQAPAVRADRTSQTAELPPADEISIFSQSSGWWANRKYGGSNLQKSGCAIFALSHALQWLGFEGEEITPDALAKKYAFCLREDGTINSTLVGNAGDDLGFKTRYDLYHDLRTISTKFEEGAVFSFAVVSGHIAMAADISSDGSMVRVIDSAPSATWERIGQNKLYIQQNGAFVPIDDLADIPGIRYYPETDAFGGASYWLESSYAARRGLRLIQPE